MSEPRNNNENSQRKKRVYVTKETIKNFIRLLCLEKKQSEMMSLMDLSKSTIQRLTRRFYNGDFGVEGNIISSEDKKRGKKKDTSIRTNFINLELSTNPCTTLRSLSLNLENNRDINNSLSTLHRGIKSMNYSRKIITKIPSSRNSDANKTQRVIYANLISNISDNDLIFLDESGFNLHLTLNYGYSPKNIKAYTTVPNSKGTNVSFMCTISNNGIYRYKIKIGSFKSTDLLDFINNDIPLLTNNSIKHIIMDNASIHKTQEVALAFAQRGYIVHFLPPYSPHLNPIEEFFSAFKSKFLRRERCNNLQEIVSTIYSIANTETFEMKGYFKHMREWIEKSLMREDLI
ncbi:hypothetical protein DMUE_4896 [Dictyocoela muelleri]|nr:hypothetical protein DMUE_4896 [Dictyocoela muelleri]